jgi:hypothetical protein
MSTVKIYGDVAKMKGWRKLDMFPGKGEAVMKEKRAQRETGTVNEMTCVLMYSYRNNVAM